MENYKHKRSIKVLLAASVLAFLSGALARSASTGGGPAWLDGIVGIMLGLTACFASSASIYSIYDRMLFSKRRSLNDFFGLLICMGILLFGVIMMFAGIARFVELVSHMQ